MINSAILRLTAWYLGIVMALSMGFSVALYQIYKNQLQSGLRLPSEGIVRQLLDSEAYRLLREEQVALILSHIQQNLVLLNIAMFGVGGVVSYVLARRNLQPVADAMEAQSRFTADASHELRTPLAAMQTEVEVALRNPSLTKAQAKKLLQSNLEEVAKLKALSDGLLKLAQSGSKELPMAIVSLEQVANQAAQRVAGALTVKQIKLEKHIRPVLVRGDQASLTELLVLLLDNAIKYSSKGKTVTLTIKRHGRQAHIRVSDQGRGIRASDVPHIFDRFYRTDQSRSKEKTDGYGLGLSIARKIVEVHQGSIEVKSAPGKGSTFTVKLLAQTRRRRSRRKGFSPSA
jgi:signal transduction histidine kinase